MRCWAVGVVSYTATEATKCTDRKNGLCEPLVRKVDSTPRRAAAGQEPLTAEREIGSEQGGAVRA